MHPEDIKASLRKAGSSPAAISRAKSVSKMAVSHVIHGNSKSLRIAKAVADVTKIPVSQLWPGKYPQLEFLEHTGLLNKPAAQIEQQLAKVTKPRRTSRQTTTRRKA